MKTVELKLSYDRSFLISLEDFSTVIKTLEKCKFVTRNNVRVDGEYKTFYQLSEFNSEMSMIDMPKFVTEWPLSDWEKEELVKKQAQADEPDSTERFYVEAFQEVGSND